VYLISAMLRALRQIPINGDTLTTQRQRGFGDVVQACTTRRILGLGLLSLVVTQSSLAGAASKSTKPTTASSKSSSATPAKSSTGKTTNEAPKGATKAPLATANAKTTGNAKSVAPAKVVPLKSLSARVAVTGWDHIGSISWPDTGDSVIATAKGDWVDVYRNPADPNTSLRLIKGRSVAGPVVLMAVGADGDYVRVAIPLRPNGTLGWVRRSDVTLVRSAFRVEVDLSTNTMTVFDGDKVSLRASIAAGTGGTPTPRGLFFLKEVVPQTPGGALGPFAFGLSGFSDVLTSFGGGEGVIGIHGTNAPGKLGTNVSHGCVRVDNVTISKMARSLPLGTPVEIIESAKAIKPTRTSSAWLETLLNGSTSPVAAPLNASLASASEAATPPVVLLTEPIGATNQPSAAASVPAGPVSATTPVSSSTIPATTVPFNDDPLGAVVAR
jgi:lipoprotein-anchoring transpeptidase ErfK/SrfK